MDYKSRLQLNAPSLAYPLSGIVCTIGPATRDPEMLLKLIHAGMRVIRLNFSHGNHEYHFRTLTAVRQAIKCYVKQMGVYKPVAIALDTKGPEIRTGQLEGNASTGINLKQGDCIKLTTKKDMENKCTNSILYVNYERLHKIVKPCDLIFIDDGLIALRVQEVAEEDVVCEILNSGVVGSHKGVNLPGLPVDLPSVSESDKADIKFGVDYKVDMIFASFIRNVKDVEEIRNALGAKGRHIKVISKIENQQGMQNLDEIIKASDGIMVARGDLGIELPPENVVLAQKSMIAKCNRVGKPVICATQMLESMIDKPRPTRAETNDVANAIFDGADCVMLSEETAKGKYPEECVKCMAKICAKTESVLWYEHIQNEVRNSVKRTGSDGLTSLTSGIAEIASLGRAKAILIVSRCPMVAHLVSQYRPRCPIIMLTHSPQIARQSVIFRGIYPIIVKEMAHGCNDYEAILSSGIKQMAKMKLIDTDTTVSVMSVNALEAHKISFRLLSFNHPSLESKCMKAAQAKVKSSKKARKCNKSPDDITKSSAQIRKCKKMAEKRQKRRDAKKRAEQENDLSKSDICKMVMAQAKITRDEDC